MMAIINDDNNDNKNADNNDKDDNFLETTTPTTHIGLLKD